MAVLKLTAYLTPIDHKMKVAACCLLTVAVFAYGATATGFDHDKGWFVPTENDEFEWYSKARFDAESAEVAIEPRAAAVKFYLYTKSNPSSPQLINVNDATALSKSHFNKANPTRFIIHGWKGDYTHDVNKDVRAALLATGSYNVFCVDWSAQAQTANYASARNAVPSVGSAVAAFVDFLNLKGAMSFGTLDIIGHSLGAHVAGFTGKLVKRGKVHTIHGLDPAMPLFSYSDCATRLCTTDASYVESIQTNGGLLGFLQPIGKSAFYPNGGKTQPGCGIDANGSCAHARSFIYYAEAIRKNDFPSMKCSTYEKAVDKNCGSTYSSVRMGAASNYGVGGYFYVPVKSAAPYGMGA